MTLPTSPELAYSAARTAIAWADLRGLGWQRVSGRDRLDFLQRLSTNDFRKLAPGAGLPTVLATATGRMIALLIACATEDALYLRTPPGRAGALASHFNSLIFWNDELEVSDLSAETVQIGLFGPGAARWLADATGASLDDLQPYACRSGIIGGTPAMIQRGGLLEAPDWTVIAAAKYVDELRAILTAAAPALNEGQVEVIRVEKGIPAWGSELSDQVTPLEAGLRDAVSDNKGCYTGQEVIARQLNYDKVTRRMVGLLLPADATIAELRGATIAAGGSGHSRGGFVGTTVWSPALDRPIALAFVPRDMTEPGSVVAIKHAGAEIAGEVTGLPFVRQESRQINKSAKGRIGE
jgi:tRNA-modifying protein YgfZ